MKNNKDKKVDKSDQKGLGLKAAEGFRTFIRNQD